MRGSFAGFDLRDGLVYQLDRSLPVAALVRSGSLQTSAGFAQVLESRLHMRLAAIGRRQGHGYEDEK